MSCTWTSMLCVLLEYNFLSEPLQPVLYVVINKSARQPGNNRRTLALGCILIFSWFLIGILLRDWFTCDWVCPVTDAFWHCDLRDGTLSMLESIRTQNQLKHVSLSTPARSLFCFTMLYSYATDLSIATKHVQTFESHTWQSTKLTTDSCCSRPTCWCWLLGAASVSCPLFSVGR
jgi:hypothetical protein